MYEEGRGIDQNLEEAFKWYKMAAQQDNPKAQYALGAMYEEGRGTDKDLEEAIMWYKKAEKQGVIDASVALLFMKTGQK